jgi:hypothetical protein
LFQKLDDGDLPDPKHLWKEFCGPMRSVEGHKYWATEGVPLECPKKAIFVIPESNRWPKPKALPAAPVTSTGKKLMKPLSVGGKKYNQRGGYSAKIVGPGLQPGLAAALVEAANFSLASSTWRSYSSVWRQVGKVAEQP